MKMTIRRGEPQPLPCPTCNMLYGYVTSTYMKTHYHTEYDGNGALMGGQYSEYQPVIRELKTAVCANCGGTLPFWINTED